MYEPSVRVPGGSLSSHASQNKKEAAAPARAGVEASVKYGQPCWLIADIKSVIERILDISTKD